MVVLVMPNRDYVPVGGQRGSWVGSVIAYEVELHFIDDLEAIGRVSGRLRRPVSDHARSPRIAPGHQEHGEAAGRSRFGDDAVLVNVPPMAAAFFQGTVGQFMAYNAFGQGQQMQPTRPGGGYAPVPTEPVANASTSMNDPARAHRPAVG